MPFKSKRSTLELEKKDIEFLENLAASRTEQYAKVKRARILLAYARGETISGIARKEHTNRPVVERCVDKALSGGIMTALRDLARQGRPPEITDEDKSWVIHMACTKPTEYGYAADRWTFAQLAKHIREHAEENGYPALTRMGKSGLHNILSKAQIKRVFPASMRNRHFFHLAVKRSIVNHASSKQTGKRTSSGSLGVVI